MVTLLEHVHTLAKLFWLSGYLGCHNRREHWRLRELAVFFIGAIDYYAFEAEGLRLWRRMQRPTLSPFVHILGGSSYGAFLTRKEAQYLITSFARALGIPCAMVGLHLGKDGRFDFHLAAANYTDGGIALSHRDILKLARQIMRRLVNELNRQRLRENRYLIANFTVEGEVVYTLLDFDREQEKLQSESADASSGPQPTLPSASPSQPQPQAILGKQSPEAKVQPVEPSPTPVSTVTEDSAEEKRQQEEQARKKKEREEEEQRQAAAQERERRIQEALHELDRLVALERPLTEPIKAMAKEIFCKGAEPSALSTRFLRAYRAAEEIEHRRNQHQQNGALTRKDPLDLGQRYRTWDERISAIHHALHHQDARAAAIRRALPQWRAAAAKDAHAEEFRHTLEHFDAHEKHRVDKSYMIYD